MTTEIFLSYGERTGGVAHAILHKLSRMGLGVRDAGHWQFDPVAWPQELRWHIENSAGCLIVADAEMLDQDAMLRREIGMALGLKRPVTWLMPVTGSDGHDLLAPEAVRRAFFDPTSFEETGTLQMQFDDDDPILTSLVSGVDRLAPLVGREVVCAEVEGRIQDRDYEIAGQGSSYRAIA
ncbi:MAG: hypothetical protein R3D67_01170 [Hyphomicrobiaceae bacterium]